MYKNTRLAVLLETRICYPHRARDDLATDSVRSESPLLHVPVSYVARASLSNPWPMALVPTLGPRR